MTTVNRDDDARNRLGHGRFLPWIEQEFGGSEPTAQRFMRVSREFKSVNLTDVQIDVSSLYLLAAPKTPEVMDPRGERKYSDR